MNELLLSDYKKNEFEIAEIEKQINFVVGELINQKNALIEKNDEIREKIKNAMEENGVKKLENEYIAITYVAPTTRNSIDSKMLKEKYENIYNECLKTSEVKASLRIKIKENEIKITKDFTEEN